MDEASPAARRLGAVNTLWLEGGRLHGDNTDVTGFVADLDQRLGADVERRRSGPPWCSAPAARPAP